jgi:ethanolamine ammonia-lyase large subunit
VQITRADLEDHFVGKLMGVPTGVDVCYTNHADADQNSNDNLLVLLASAGCTFVMAVPAGDDVMLDQAPRWTCHDVPSIVCGTVAARRAHAAEPHVGHSPAPLPGAAEPQRTSPDLLGVG